MRLSGLDIARFLAFSGMVLVNFRIAAEVPATTDLPGLFTTLLEGRAAALFVILAGIGTALANPPAAILFRRAIFLFVLGLINLTIFDADILHFYALYFICALPVLTWPSQKLILLAGGVTMGGFLALITLNYDAGWDWGSYTYQDFWTLSGFLRHSFFNGWHPVLPWVAFFFIGMAVGRVDLAKPCTQHRLMIWGTAATLAGLIPSLLVHDPELAELVTTAPIPPTPFYILSASGSALAMVGLCLWAGAKIANGLMGRAMALAGRQSLTLYLTHILLGMGLLEELGWLNGSLSSGAIFLYSLGFILVCLIYALIWQLVGKRGPLEALMRRTAG
jgi:uncharacterized membrane protein YeiB